MAGLPMDESKMEGINEIMRDARNEAIDDIRFEIGRRLDLYRKDNDAGQFDQAIEELEELDEWIEQVCRW